MAAQPIHALPPGQRSLDLTSSSAYMEASPVIHEGWVLKKRRKKMQGTYQLTSTVPRHDISSSA